MGLRDRLAAAWRWLVWRFRPITGEMPTCRACGANLPSSANLTETLWDNGVEIGTRVTIRCPDCGGDAMHLIRISKRGYVEVPNGRS